MAKSIAVRLTAGVVLGVLSASPPSEAGDQPYGEPIHVSELAERQLVGWLGRPLGTIVVVEGVVADGSYTKLKGDEGEILLRVQSVDGARLPAEHEFHFRPWASVKKPKVGSKFKYTGYETGEFSGVPAEAFKYVPAVATTSYHFEASFMVLRDEMSQK